MQLPQAPLRQNLTPAPGALQRNVFWANVSAFGALWGCLEITLGAFIHTLRLPLLAGVLLSTVGATLLVAQRQLLPRRGATLATGIVAAICKSVSPGGIILGPMIGIASEGLLAEAALFLWPRSRVSAAVAGMLCALWATFQTIFSKFIFYGASILELYLALLDKTRQWAGLSLETGISLLLLLAAAIALFGASGGLVGWHLGKESCQRLQTLPKRGLNAP